MNFLALGIDDVPGIISRVVRFLESLLCQLFYPLIAQLYEVFRKMGLLFYNDDFSTIYKKISLVLGIYMVFRISFWLIELLVNPDKISDKEKNPSKIITRTILVVVMLAITPMIFKYAFRIQYEIVDKAVIEKVIVLNGTNTGDNVGRYLAANLFDNFYYINGETGQERTDNIKKCMNGDKEYNKSYTNLLLTTGDLYMSSECLNSTYKGNNPDTGIKEKTYVLHFDGFYAALVGGIVVWLLLMYCISVGTRYVQLIFLQVIAPIPIMCYVSPSKDNMFDKWVKQCVVTYLDLFIRVAIISFSMMLCQVVFSSNMLNVPNFSGSWIIKIFLVLGLLTFAKKAPDLIQELLPKSVTKASGDFGLSWKKRKDAMLGGKQIFGAASAVAKGVPIGLATGLVGAAGGRGWGRLSGFFGGVARGTINGGKKGNAFKNLNASIQKQNQVNKRKIDWANSGSTWSGRMAQRLDNAFGLEGTAEGYETEINKNNDKIKELKSSIAKEKRISSTYGRVSKLKSDMKAEAEDKILHEAFDPKEDAVAYAIQKNVLDAKAKLDLIKNNPNASVDEIRSAEEKYNATLKQAKTDFITGVFNRKIKNAKIGSWKEDARAIIERNDDDAFKGMDASKIFDSFGGDDGFDKFEGQVKNADNVLHREKIDVIEHDIKTVEDRNSEIQASEEYQKAVADRNAVGGSSGKKSQ